MSKNNPQSDDPTHLSEPLRRLPSVDRVLAQESVRELLTGCRREYVRKWVDEILGGLRAEILAGRIPNGSSREDLLRTAVERLLDRAAHARGLGLRRVINATGVIVHTNLGRSPLAPAVLDRLTAALGGYTDLEYDLATGGRGHRDASLAALLRELLPCGDATAVNNNAAALFLILGALARGNEVIVSRGELVEIGGSFRIPEIMARSGATLVEAGTTNRTRLADYRAALTPNTRLILQVHRSNFELTGFTEKPAVEELAALSRETGVPLVVDAGSGYLFECPELPIRAEPVVERLLSVGVDLVCFSGDKLLGGPQAGVIAGRADLVERLRRDPLMRVLRLDKLVLGTLAATLQLYFRPDREQAIPVLAMTATDAASSRQRCRRFRRRLIRAVPAAAPTVSIQPGTAVIGGGSTPGRVIPGYVLALQPGPGRATALEALLRGGSPPVIARIEGDRVLLDLRTVLPDEEPHLLSALSAALQP